MYHWIEDKRFLGRMRALCSGLVNQLVQAINNEEVLEVRQHLVGSGAKNLITQNGSQPIDLDYNLEIIDCIEYDINNCRAIKEYVRKKFNEILNRNGWDDCCDSTSALTTGTYYFTDGNGTEFSIDLCIVCLDSDGDMNRLIHQKTGYAAWDRYYWNKAAHSRGLEEHVQWLKKNGYWIEVREAYLKKKNMYLSRGDGDHPSFIVYIEAVNEVCTNH